MKDTTKNGNGGLGRKIGRISAKVGIFLAELVLLLLVAVYCIGKLVANGPSEYASGILAGFFAETGVFKKGQPLRFVANFFYSEEELAVYEQPAPLEDDPAPSVQILPYATAPQPTQPGEALPSGPQPDAWGLIDEDGDGIIIEKVRGQSFTGYMMVVLDPSRVIMGSRPDQFDTRGYTVHGMAESFGAVAGINAGGFEDDGGMGDGSTPNSMVVVDGKVYYASKGCQNGFAGFDSNHQLHVGKFSGQKVQELDIQYGASFGPVLIQDGVVNTEGIKNSGVNPRTAIGQRYDGAVLMLVIEGRQSTSLGATYQDLADVFLDFGAVNACNMDGGSSSLLYFNGSYINNSASLVGVRPMPTTFLVLAKGDNHE